MRPSSIVNFERVVLLMLVLGIANAALTWDKQVAQVAAQGFGSGLLIAVQLIGIAITLLLLWLIAHRRSNVARWIWVVLGVLGLVVAAWGFRGLPNLPVLELAMQPASWLLSLASIWLLFRPDTRAWFGHDEGAASS